MRFHLFRSVLTMSLLIITSIMTTCLACTCIGKGDQVTASAFKSVDVVVKGKIISVTNYTYYDTMAYSLAGIKFNPKEHSLLVRNLNLYHLLIDKTYKSTSTLPDTISVISERGSGSCGFEFTVGKEYILYGNAWKEKAIHIRQRWNRSKKRVIENERKNTFYTDICTFTQEANKEELKNLERFTKRS